MEWSKSVRSSFASKLDGSRFRWANNVDRAFGLLELPARCPGSRIGERGLVCYHWVNSVGDTVNPFPVEKQIHVGVLKGIDQAPIENTLYDEHGHLHIGSFMKCAPPRASNVPPAISVLSHPVPAKTYPLDIQHFHMPATPRQNWQADRAASK